MIQIGLKGLAKFMTASPANQRKILREYKYPKEEGLPLALYYREARDLIQARFANKHTGGWLKGQAAILRGLADATGGRSGTRLRINARGMEEFVNNFLGLEYQILPHVDLTMVIAEVRVRINPDLHVKSGNTEKMVKLEFSKKKPDDRQVKIICQLLFEGAERHGLDLPSSSVLYLDVARGVEHRGARLRSRTRTEIEAACENITSLWEKI